MSSTDLRTQEQLLITRDLHVIQVKETGSALLRLSHAHRVYKCRYVRAHILWIHLLTATRNITVTIATCI